MRYATRFVPSLSGTFGIPSRLALNPKMPKEPSSPSRSNALTVDPYKTKIGDKLIRMWLIMNKAQCLTAGIVHAGFSGVQRFVARKKCLYTLISNRLVHPHDTIPAKRCHQLKKAETEKLK